MYYLLLAAVLVLYATDLPAAGSRYERSGSGTVP